MTIYPGKEVLVLSAKPERVLHIVSAMNRGGTETLLMNVYRNLDHSRVQFDFVSHRNEKCDYDDEIESLGGKVYRMASLGNQGPVGYIKGMRKILKENSYIAVHSHTDFQSGFPALSAKLSGIKKRICHSHSNQWTDHNGWKEKLILKLLQTVIQFSATDYCACSLEAGRFLFGNKKLTNGKVTVLKNGIDLKEYISDKGLNPLNIRDELGLNKAAIVIGHVGNFSQVKNQSFILKLLKESQRLGLNYAAVFAGDGPLRTRIEAESKTLGLSEHVRFLGARTDIPMLMKAFDVFVFPSLFEGFGMVTIEAQCAGTPCVVSDSVPKSTDMGLNLISYLDLNDRPIVWVKEINRMMLQEKPDRESIEVNFKKNGFSIQESIPSWLTLYGLSPSIQ